MLTKWLYTGMVYLLTQKEIITNFPPGEEDANSDWARK
jgi:hypothetical protein